MSLSFEPHQYTIKKSVSCCGVGLHSGRTVNLSIKPANVNSGIRFFRTDIPSDTALPAHMDSVVDTRLATTLGNDHFTISTTEHLMAAFQGFGIDNADVNIDAMEVPIMDGSAGPFLKLLRGSGKRKQNGFKKVMRITHPISYSEGDKHITISPYEGFKVTGEICFDDTLIQTQRYTFDLLAGQFGDEIAKARTFGYVEQVEELWANGLAQGGSLANVIAIHWDRKSVLNEDGLRYEDEFIRHKVLDLVGDMALLGCPVLGHVKAYKAGHAQHLGLMQTIAASPASWQMVEMGTSVHNSAFENMANISKSASKPLLPIFHSNSLPVALPA
ncbi:MAG: UDP-3-O-[3-hydroxymyristoyl] N-acetylglucosamine deacetylase [Desulforhopalus sp.]|jgi:UDP-3-O-[3-hydroxymyristoyl] N-acetylglucosamine deacetylase